MLLESMDKQRYFPRAYVVAATDRMSGAKAQSKEQAWQVREVLGCMPEEPCASMLLGVSA